MFFETLILYVKSSLNETQELNKDLGYVCEAPAGKFCGFGMQVTIISIILVTVSIIFIYIVVIIIIKSVIKIN